MNVGLMRVCLCLEYYILALPLPQNFLNFKLELDEQRFAWDYGRPLKLVCVFVFACLYTVRLPVKCVTTCD